LKWAVSRKWPLDGQFQIGSFVKVPVEPAVGWAVKRGSFAEMAVGWAVPNRQFQIGSFVKVPVEPAVGWAVEMGSFVKMPMESVVG
jgi:hypothetical protein